MLIQSISLPTMYLCSVPDPDLEVMVGGGGSSRSFNKRGAQQSVGGWRGEAGPSFGSANDVLLNSLKDQPFSCNTDKGPGLKRLKRNCNCNTALLFIITFYWSSSCQPDNLMFFSQCVVGHRFWFWRLTVISNNGTINSIDQERPSQSYALFDSLLFVCFLCCMVHY